MRLGRMKLAEFLPAMATLVVVTAVLSSACINLMTEPSSLSTGTSTELPSRPGVPPPGIPEQLAALSTSGHHRVIFTYYDGSAIQTWATKIVAHPDTTLKDFPIGNPPFPGHVFVRWIYTDTSADPVSYPEFTSATPVVGDLEVRAYHQALPTLYYDPNEAGGTAPASVSVLVSGEAVRLAGQGELIAPAGTVFGGWYAREWTGSAYVRTGQYQAGDLFQLACSTSLNARWDAVHQTSMGSSHP
ncbi:MAG: hypothetical protein ABIJ86_14585 [Spirochaetota bacterium]